MSAEASGRFGVRGSISGFVVHEPANPVRDAVQTLKVECDALIERMRARLAQGKGLPRDEAEPDPETPELSGLITAAPSEMNAHSDTEQNQPAIEKSPGLNAKLFRDRLVAAFRSLWSAAAFTALKLRNGLVQMRSLLASLGIPAVLQRLASVLVWLLLPLLERIPMPYLALPRPFASKLAGVGAALAALIVLAPQSVEVAPPAPIRPAVAAAPSWREVIRPLAVFNLEGGALARSTVSYRANIRSDGAQEDVMSWGPPGTLAAAPIGVVVVHRHPPVEVTEQRLFSEIARRAASFGQSLQSASTSTAIATKFGDLEVMDIRLSGQGGDQSCLAFRHVAWSAPLAFTGWRCGTAEKPIDRPGLVCFIDRLDVLSAGQELWLRDYFAESEHFRSFCANKHVSAGIKPGWQSPQAKVPALKPEVTGTVSQKRAAKPGRKPKRKKTR